MEKPRVMPSVTDGTGLGKLALAIWLASLMFGLALPVHAEVHVSGVVDALTVETREASVEEVLSALRASFDLKYRTSDALNRLVSGTYTGSLQRVVARLVDGQNYVMRLSPSGGVEIFVLGTGASRSGAALRVLPAVANARQPELPAASGAKAAGRQVPLRAPNGWISAPKSPADPHANLRPIKNGKGTNIDCCQPFDKR